MENYVHLEHLSVATGLGISVIDPSYNTLYESSVHNDAAGFLKILYEKLDCEESCRVAFLFGCYQARRFGGRYIFYAPSGLYYCTASILDCKGKLISGILAGPFLMTDYNDYINYELPGRVSLSKTDLDLLWQNTQLIPCLTPKQAHSVSELLCYIAATHFSQIGLAESVPAQTDAFNTAYPIEKEAELQTAISKGDIHTANAVLADIIKQVVYYYGGNIEVLRSRVVELTVLLSRAALKGGADTNEILGLNYDYLREIDSFTSIEDIVLWLQTITRQFTQHVFDFSDAKHMDIIYKAVEYIKRNYSSKITMQEIADYLYISRQYFCRIFKEGTGQTPGAYVTFVRIEESKKILRKSAINIVDIPEAVGFESQSYFTKIFKKETGFTPGQYRRENLER